MPGSEKAQRPRGQGAADGPAEMSVPDRSGRQATWPRRGSVRVPGFRASSRAPCSDGSPRSCGVVRPAERGRMDDEVTRGPGEKEALPSTEQAAFYLVQRARCRRREGPAADRCSGGIVVTSAIISTILTTGRERPGTARAMPELPGPGAAATPGRARPASMVLAASRRPASVAALLRRSRSRAPSSRRPGRCFLE